MTDLFLFHIQGSGKLVFMERDSLRRLYEFDVIESVSRIFLPVCVCFVTVSVRFEAYPLNPTQKRSH